MSYTWHERATYRPPCPTCGEPLIDIDWHDVCTYVERDAWVPGLAYCHTEGCPGQPSSGVLPRGEPGASAAVG